MTRFEFFKFHFDRHDQATRVWMHNSACVIRRRADLKITDWADSGKADAKFVYLAPKAWEGSLMPLIMNDFDEHLTVDGYTDDETSWMSHDITECRATSDGVIETVTDGRKVEKDRGRYRMPEPRPDRESGPVPLSDEMRAAFDGCAGCDTTLPTNMEMYGLFDLPDIVGTLRRFLIVNIDYDSDDRRVKGIYGGFFDERDPDNDCFVCYEGFHFYTKTIDGSPVFTGKYGDYGDKVLDDNIHDYEILYVEPGDLHIISSAVYDDIFERCVSVARDASAALERVFGHIGRLETEDPDIVYDLRARSKEVFDIIGGTPCGRYEPVKKGTGRRGRRPRKAAGEKEQ